MLDHEGMRSKAWIDDDNIDSFHVMSLCCMITWVFLDYHWDLSEDSDDALDAHHELVTRDSSLDEE